LPEVVTVLGRRAGLR